MQDYVKEVGSISPEGPDTILPLAQGYAQDIINLFENPSDDDKQLKKEVKLLSQDFKKAVISAVQNPEN